MQFNLLSPFRLIGRSLYELVYPPLCLSCGSLLDEDGRLLCLGCSSSVRKLSQYDQLYREKLYDLTSNGSVSGLVSVFHFEKDGILQHLVHKLKYQEMTGIGFELGKSVGEMIRPMLGDVTFTGIVPVPLHPVKERERGYNQSDFIAKGIKAVTGTKVLPQVLKRIRHTKTQTALNAAERKENIAGAFAVNSRQTSGVQHATLLLVDDIITTGATVIECANVLKRFGAENVYAACIAVPDLTHLP